MTTQAVGRRRVIEGTVVSDKMKKTIVVQSTRLVRHTKYGKYFRKSSKFKAHDETETSKVGDRVEIIESRPISKDKKFRLLRVVERARVGAGAEINDEVPLSQERK